MDADFRAVSFVRTSWLFVGQLPNKILIEADFMSVNQRSSAVVSAIRGLPRRSPAGGGGSMRVHLRSL